ncbi:hypothetical protein FGD71_030170 [Streptomyces sporangiiformans]|uniref:Uncharacterized protein n=1 Tax=Streptomyces sporangiiformans TaxID=2315329 RepID=A0A505D7N2_9ACTN|nr:hypothetical protein FGD71_030170 [Streptomyces sporangiiformans]
MGRHALRATPLPDPDVVFRPTRRDIAPVTGEPSARGPLACHACLYELGQRVLETNMRQDTGALAMNSGPARSRV